MSETEAGKLTTNTIRDVDLAIMEILWLHMEEVGLSRTAIKDALAKRGTIRTDSAVKVHLHHLRSRPYHLLSVTTGRKPLYRIDRDQMITWPSTAVVVLELWKFHGQAMKRQAFMDRILFLKIKDMTTDGKSIEAESLSNQIEFAVKWGYLAYINDDRLIPANRLIEELEFLKFIASHS